MNKKGQSWAVILEGGWLLAVTISMIYFWVASLWGRALIFTILFIVSLIVAIVISRS